MTINERVSDDRLDTIKSWRETYGQDANVMIPASEAESIISELQQYRAAADPVAWLLSGGGAKNDVRFDSSNAYADPLREVTPLYAAPQVTSVPEEATPESIEVLASVRPPHGVAFQLDGYDRKLASDIWNACRGAMLTDESESAAPAVQAEQLSGNSPAIPDFWIPVSERMPETDGNYWGWWSESRRQGPVWFIKSEIQAQFQSSEITHWMPLPVAPKQEAE